MIAFDFEVFSHDWLVVFKDMITNEYKVVINDSEELERIYNLYSKDLLIGFNNNHYDNYILRGIMLGIDPYYLTKVIIEQKAMYKVYRMANWNSLPLNSYDVSFSVGFTSLKENEAYLGISIDECPVDFRIQRPLTKEEIELVIEYCKRDVDATQLLFEMTRDTFETKLYLISTFDLSKDYINKSSQELIGKILSNGKKIYFDDEFEPFDFSQLDLRIEKYKGVVEHFSKPISQDYKSISYSCDIQGIHHEFGIGGIHGAIGNFKHSGKLMLIDVEGYYPSMMIAYDWFARNIPQTQKELYAKMKSDRAVLKKTNPRLSDAYKLVLNTTFGCYKFPNSILLDPRMSNNICIGGQVMLVDLIEQLEPYCQLVQSNTDGIIIIPKDEEKIKELVADWEVRTRMKMEISYANRIYQKDVNNYVLRMEDGKIKSVGAYVKQFNGKAIRNTMSVVDKALVEHMVNDVSIEEYIHNNNNVKDYQIISKVGKTYDEVFLEKDGVKYPTNFVNRSFAGFEPARLYKKKEGKNKELVANHPPTTMLWNNDINEMDISKINKQWYIDLAYKRLSDYNGR